MRSYYRNMVQNQMQGIVTRPTVGMNEYSPSISLNDNFLSDMLDAEPYREEAIKLFAKEKEDITGHFTNNVSATGNILAYITDHPVGDDPSILLLILTGTPSSLYVKRLDMDDYGIGIFLVSSSGSAYTGDYDSCLFKTEAKNYVCFTASAKKELIWFDYSTTGLVTLPFYPKKIVSHVNRIFALDTGNKLWWCRAGDFFTWYSLAYDDDALMASTSMKNGTYTLTAQPARAGVITATVTSVSTADTMGTLTLIGTYNGISQTETLTPVSNQRVQSVKTYDAVTSIEGSGWSSVDGTDQISFGVGPAGGYVQDDAGYWTMEKERNLIDFDVISNVLYIFATNHIYAFTGYSPDTFALQLVITDIGIIKSGETYSDLVQANNKLYFINGSDVYEFDGSSAPRIISHPVYINGTLNNGVLGGIELTDSSYTGFDLANYWKLSTDKEYLYIYISNYRLSLSDYRMTVYKFNYDTRTWWRVSGMDSSLTAISSDFMIYYISDYKNTLMYTIVNKTGGESVPSYFDVFDDIGFSHEFTMYKGIYDNLDEKGVNKYPFIITKAYNTNPSELGTLTTIILMLSGTKGETCDLDILYSLTTSQYDFVSFYKDSGHVFTGDIETIEIPLPVSYIANTHHYRLKIIAKGDAVYIYNLERRFRVKGRTR